MGLSQQGLVLRNGQYLASDVWPALEKVQLAAAQHGFDLRLASAYRSFDRQLLIWNAKAQGLRPVFDESGQALTIADLSPEELLHAILRWSALPGASRHHWGTDFDIYDAAALEPGQGFELLGSECEPGGLFGEFYQCLDALLREHPCFYRPYAEDQGGVSPEPWHLSYQPLAQQCFEGFEPQALKKLIENTDIALKQPLLKHFDELIERYFMRVSLC